MRPSVRAGLLTVALAVAVPAVAPMGASAQPAVQQTLQPTGQPIGTDAAAPDGALQLESTEVPIDGVLEVDYAVAPADPTNWIGVYSDPGSGPVDQEYVGPSLAWTYVDATSGTAEIDLSGLAAGEHLVFGLRSDGYEWFAEPVPFEIVDDRPLGFVTDHAPLRHARSGVDYAARIDGLLRGTPGQTTFRRIDGSPWVRVGRDGAITGTPGPAAPRRSFVRVRATRGDATAVLRATIDVRRKDEELVPELNALSWNLWHGGTRVSDARAKQLRFLLEHDVDVVGVQESEGTSARDLADRLGWHSYQAGADVGILSRYPIVRRGATPADSGLPANDVVVRLDPRRRTDVAVWNAHLGYTPYGPYDACFGQMTIDELRARERESGRTPQIRGILAAMRADLAAADDTPVLLMGDFNAPSHLDWTAATQRCGYADVPWPTSVLPTRAGLVDTFRVANPNPRRSPGTTWSPIYDTFTGGYGHDEHTGEPEPQDRIDFVYSSGRGLVVTGSETLVEGDPTPIPDHADNAWTSDHAAVLTTFDVR